MRCTAVIGLLISFAQLGCWEAPGSPAQAVDGGPDSRQPVYVPVYQQPEPEPEPEPPQSQAFDPSRCKTHCAPIDRGSISNRFLNATTIECFGESYCKNQCFPACLNRDGEPIDGRGDLMFWYDPDWDPSPEEIAGWDIPNLNVSFEYDGCDRFRGNGYHVQRAQCRAIDWLDDMYDFGIRDARAR